MKKGIIKNFFRVQASKKQHGIIIGLVLSIVAVLWLSAQILFEGEYSILNNHISNQGRPDLNPKGFLFFTVGCMISGIFLIFHFIYLYNNYSPTLKPILILSTAFGVIASISFTVLGFIPGTISWSVHNFFADLAFSSFYLSSFLFLIIMLRKIQKKEAWPSIKKVGIVYGIFFIILILTIVIPQLDFLADEWNLDERLFQPPLWQWTSLFNIVIWLLNIYLIIPSE